MKPLSIAGLAFALLINLAVVRGGDEPKMPAPQREHEWLNQFVGEWKTEAECYMDPGKPPIKITGTETVRSLGGFWIVGEGKSEAMGMSFSNILTLGYDPAKKKYVGTWVDSMTGYLWKYEGTVDASGKTLTLNTEGPCPMTPGKISKFKEVTEFKGKDHRVFTSSRVEEDGKLTKMVTVESKKTK
jgi:hypothetical protein